MFHGGTNFGFINGAMHFDEYKSDVTSYGKYSPKLTLPGTPQHLCVWVCTGSPLGTALVPLMCLALECPGREGGGLVWIVASSLPGQWETEACKPWEQLGGVGGPQGGRSLHESSLFYLLRPRGGVTPALQKAGKTPRILVSIHYTYSIYSFRLTAQSVLLHRWVRTTPQRLPPLCHTHGDTSDQRQGPGVLQTMTRC